MKDNKPDSSLLVKKLSKSFSCEVTYKQDDAGEYTGEVTARVATLDVWDHDNDRLNQGFAGRQQVLISQWAHGSSIGSMRAVGKGVMFEEGDGLYFEGTYNLNLQDAVDDFESVRYSGEILEWSFGLIPEEAAFVEREDGSFGRDILKARLLEASPVIAGAGIGTGTISAKNQSQEQEDETDPELASVSHVAVREFVKSQARQRINRYGI